MKQELLQLIKKDSFNTKLEGFLLIEILLATSLFVMFITAFTGAYLYGETTTVGAGDRVSALMYAESGMEAVRNIRNEDFENLLGGQHGLLYTGGKWIFSGTEDVSGQLKRTVTVATTSLDRKSVTVDVSWQNGPQGTSTVSLTRIFSNWLNLRYWYIPGLISAKALAAGGDKVMVQGNYAYVIGYSAATLYIIDVTSSSSPSVVGSLTLAGTLNGMYVSGNYVYVTSTDNVKELQVVNVTNKSAPTVAGTYNAPGNTSGMGVHVIGTKLYMTRKNSNQDQFLILDITTPANPSLLGSATLGADGYGVVASGTYAYVATNNNVKELQIIDISNAASPTIVGYSDISATAQTGNTAISLEGNMVYMGQGKDLYVVDATSKTSPVVKNITSVTDDFNDISKNLGNKGRYIFVATSDMNKEFKVYDVSSSTAPIIYGTSLDITGSTPLFGIAFSTSTNLVYGVSHSTTNSFFIIAP